MAGVFLSYDRDDADKARMLALALEKAGHEVWWDLHVRGGAQFSKVIEEALKAADAVVVLWSAHSIESAWVRGEAAAGRDSGRLVPVTIDGTKAPLGFRQFQTIDLSSWKGRGKSPQLANLLADIESMGKRPAATTTAPEQASERPSTFRLDWRLIGVAVAVILAVGVALWRPWAARQTAPSVVVNPAASDPFSRALARDLVVKLGSLQSAHSAPMRLISRPNSSGDKADLIVEVGRLADPSAVGANVALMTGRDRAILWSTDFQPVSHNVADLKQQIAYTAGRVLGCASNGLMGTSKPLRQETLKLYLNACAKLSEVTDEVPPVIPALLQVIHQAPRFEGAWKLLLYAEADQVRNEQLEGSVSSTARNALREHIAAARKLNPQMAEATLAEIALLPFADLVTRKRLIERAKQNSPDNPAVLSARSDFLRSVGRMREAIADASRAVELDPLSPLFHGGYFATLLYGESFEAAEQELRRVEQLWPGSSTLRDMQFRYHLRFGDPKIARSLLSEGAFEGERLFLTARAEPTPENINRYVVYALGIQRSDPGRLVWLMQGLGQFHREDELFNVMMTWPRPGDFARLEDAWFRPPLKTFRENPRFMRVAARSPLLKYWQSTGTWPDFCEEPGLPYDCKKEAARYL